MLNYESPYDARGIARGLRQAADDLTDWADNFLSDVAPDMECSFRALAERLNARAATIEAVADGVTGMQFAVPLEERAVALVLRLADGSTIGAEHYAIESIANEAEMLYGRTDARRPRGVMHATGVRAVDEPAR